MIRTQLHSFCATLAFTQSVAMAGVTKTWDGGGGDSSWHTAANWEPNGVPGPADDVVIDVPGRTLNVTFTTGSTSIASLQCHEQLSMNGGTLAINGESQVRSLVAFVGILEGSGDITITELMQWRSTNVRGTGRLIISESAGLALNGNGRGFARRVDIHGNTTWTTGVLEFTNANAQVNNYGTFTINATSETLNATTAFPAATFNNFGTIHKNGPLQGGFKNCCNVVLVTLNNSGLVRVNQGRMTIPQGLQTGPFEVSGPAGTELELISALPLTFEPGATITSNAPLTWYVGPNAGHITCNAAVSTSATSKFMGGPLEFNEAFSANAAIVDHSGASTIAFNGTSTTIGTLTTPNAGYQPRMFFNSPTTNISVLNMTDGELAGTATVNVSTSAMFTPNHSTDLIKLSGTGSVIVGETATLTLGPIMLSRLLENRGSAFVTFNTFSMNDGRLRNSGVMTLAGGGSESQVVRVAGGGPAVIENSGVLTQTSGYIELMSSNGGVTMENSGTLNLNAGFLLLNGGGVNSGTMHTAANTRLQFGKTMLHLKGSTIDGSGRNWFVSGVHDLLGTFATTGPLEVYETADVTIRTPFTPAQWVVNRGKLTNNANQTWVGFNQLSGTLTGSGDIHVTGYAILRGMHSGSGRTVIESGATLEIPTTSNIPTIGRVVESFGTTLWHSATLDFKDGTFINHGQVSAGQFINQIARGVSGANRWTSDGAFVKVSGTTVTFVDNGAPLPFDNDGSVNVVGGVLALLSGGAGEGNLAANLGTTVRVGGDLAIHDFQSSGHLHITETGQLLCQGTYVQSPGSSFQLNRIDDRRPAIQASFGCTIAGGIVATYVPPPPAETELTIIAVTAGLLDGAYSPVALSPNGMLDQQPQSLIWRIYGPGDADHDGHVGVSDLLLVIGSWGICPPPTSAPCDGDVTNDGFVNVADLLLVILHWGA